MKGRNLHKGNITGCIYCKWHLSVQLSMKRHQQIFIISRPTIFDHSSYSKLLFNASTLAGSDYKSLDKFTAQHCYLVYLTSLIKLACVAWQFCRAGRTSGVAAKFARQARENERRSREKSKNLSSCSSPNLLAVSLPSPAFIT